MSSSSGNPEQKHDGVTRAQLIKALLGEDEPLWQAFERHLLETPGAKRPTPNTLRTYRVAVTQYLSYLRWLLEQSTHADAAAEGDWEWLWHERNQDENRFLNWMGQASLATKRSRLSAIRRLNDALDQGEETLSTRHHQTLKKPKNQEPTHVRPFTAQEIARLLTDADPEERLIVLLGSELGLRGQEMTALRLAHFQMEQPHLLLLSQLAPGRHDTVISAALTQALLPWLEVERQRAGEGVGLLSGRTTRYLEDRLKALCDRASVECRGLHGLRLYAGARHFLDTGSLASVRRFLGLTGITSSKAYEWAAQEIERSGKS